MTSIEPSLLSLVSEIKNISVIDPEKTIFSIGGRGYYENTCSDVLCFFLDPNECHGLDDLVLRAFLRLLPCVTEDGEPAMLTRAPVREEITTDNKRLDIVLWLNNCVIAIENKIRHTANNPFSQYENHIKSIAEQGEKAFFVLLTPHRSAGPDNWINITYEDLIRSIECEMGQGFSNTPITKWVIFLRDFLLNLRNHTVRSAMHTEHRTFIEDNFSALSKMIQLEKAYTEEVLREVQAHLSDWPIKSIKREDWGGHGTALRIKINGWSKCNMVLLHKYSDPPEGPGSWHLRVYFYDVGHLKDEIHSTFPIDDGALSWEYKDTIAVYESPSLGSAFTDSTLRSLSDWIQETDRMQADIKDKRETA